MVIEDNYVDRDYLDDYSAYYVRCFQQYQRFCRRLHFFSIDVNSTEFQDFILGVAEPQLIDAAKNSYLGFIVVRPLPNTVIGRTCLRTYEPEGRRSYPIERKYSVDLCGLPLHVTTLAFQEQDTVVSACATSAIWTTLHATGIVYHHPIPTPSEITIAADEHPTKDIKLMVSKGLTMAQIVRALKSYSLMPFSIQLDEEPDHAHLKANVYAYLQFGIPVLLIVSIHDLTNVEQPIFEGYHAIALAGYSLQSGAPKALKVENHELLLVPERIEKIYAHDDQIGPFSRLEFLDEQRRVKIDGNLKQRACIATSWLDRNGQPGNLFFAPETLIVPLYHKIRIPYSAIVERTLAIDEALRFLSGYFELVELKNLEWDIFLSDLTHFRSHIRNEYSNDSRSVKLSVLHKPMPRYVWRAVANHNGIRLFEFVFDATGIEQGQLLLGSLYWDHQFGEKMSERLGSEFATEVLAELAEQSSEFNRMWQSLRRTG